VGRTKNKTRFAIGARVLVKRPGVVGTVARVNDAPTIMGEYWHVVTTEHGDRDEPGCNLELVPRAKSNFEPFEGARIHIEHMEHSALIQGSPGASISQVSDARSQEFKDLIRDLRELVNGACLSEDQRNEADLRFTSLYVELESPNPRTGVIRECLQSVRAILENTAANLVGSAAYAALVYYILHTKP
jgi:hypothetical protein